MDEFSYSVLLFLLIYPGFKNKLEGLKNISLPLEIHLILVLNIYLFIYTIKLNYITPILK